MLQQARTTSTAQPRRSGRKEQAYKNCAEPSYIVLCIDWIAINDFRIGLNIVNFMKYYRSYSLAVYGEADCSVNQTLFISDRESSNHDRDCCVFIHGRFGEVSFAFR